jgi:hypothetical protein
VLLLLIGGLTTLAVNWYACNKRMQRAQLALKT